MKNLKELKTLAIAKRGIYLSTVIVLISFIIIIVSFGVPDLPYVSGCGGDDEVINANTDVQQDMEIVEEREKNLGVPSGLGGDYLGLWNGQNLLVSYKPPALNRGPIGIASVLDSERNLLISWNEYKVFITHYKKTKAGSVNARIVGEIKRDDKVNHKGGVFISQQWDNNKMVLFWRDNPTSSITHQGYFNALNITNPAQPYWTNPSLVNLVHSAHDLGFTGEMVKTDEYIFVALSNGGIAVFKILQGYPFMGFLKPSGSLSNSVHYRLALLNEIDKKILVATGGNSAHFYNVTNFTNISIPSSYMGSLNLNDTSVSIALSLLPNTTYYLNKTTGRTNKRAILAIGFSQGVYLFDVSDIIEKSLFPSGIAQPVGSFLYDFSTYETALSLTIKDSFLITGYGTAGPGAMNLIAMKYNENLSEFDAKQVSFTRVTTAPEPINANKSDEFYEPLKYDADDNIFIAPTSVIWSFVAFDAKFLNKNPLDCINDMQNALANYNSVKVTVHEDIRYLSWNLNAYAGTSNYQTYSPLCKMNVIGKLGTGGEYGDWTEGMALVTNFKKKALIVTDWANGIRLFDMNNNKNPIEKQHWIYDREFPSPSYSLNFIDVYGLHPRDVIAIDNEVYISHQVFQSSMGIMHFHFNSQRFKLEYVSDIKESPINSSNQNATFDSLLSLSMQNANKKFVVVAMRNGTNYQSSLGIIDPATNTFVGKWNLDMTDTTNNITYTNRIINDIEQVGDKLYISSSDIQNNLETLKLIILNISLDTNGIPDFSIVNQIIVGSPTTTVATAEGRKITADKDGRYLYMSGMLIPHGGYLYDIRGSYSTQPLLLKWFPRNPNDAIGTNNIWTNNPILDGPTAKAIFVGNQLLIDTTPRTVWEISSQGSVSFVGYQNDGSAVFRAAVVGSDFAIAAGIYGGTHIYPFFKSGAVKNRGK